MIPKEPIKDMAWHPSGQMLAVTTTRAVHLYHVAGSFVERVSTTAIKGKGLAQSAMVQSGDHVVVLPSGGYVPLKVTLATGEVSALNFLDSRLSNSSVRAQAGTSTDTCPTLFTPCPGDKSGLRFAMPVGSRIVLGSLASSSVMQTLTLPGHVNDVVFVSEYEIAAAVGPSVLFYDTRRVGKCVRRIQDEGALECTRLCSFGGSSLVVGSSSGAVNLYQLAGVASTVAPRPAKTFLNLSTSCDLLVAGPMSAPLAASTAAAGAGAGLGAGFLMGSSQQQAGFRLVSLPEGRVTPRFPAASMNHNFVQCVAYHPTAPIFSIGEYGRIVNYAC
jgi:U3 small nucleolar RNA-associated protein 18